MRTSVTERSAEPSCDLLTIGALAALEGATCARIRYYERQGLLASRRLGHLRVYSLADRERLKAILDLRRMGLPMSQIDCILRQGARSGAGRSHPTLGRILSSHLVTLKAELASLDARIAATRAAIAERRADPPAGRC